MAKSINGATALQQFFLKTGDLEISGLFVPDSDITGCGFLILHTGLGCSKRLPRREPAFDGLSGTQTRTAIPTYSDRPPSRPSAGDFSVTLPGSGTVYVFRTFEIMTCQVFVARTSFPSYL